MYQICVDENFWIGDRVEEQIYGHGVSRGVSCWDFLLVAEAILQGGYEVVAFNAMRREGYALGGGLRIIIFIPRTTEGVCSKSKFTKR